MSSELDLEDLARDLEDLTNLAYVDRPLIDSDSAKKPQWATHACGARWKNSERAAHCADCHVTFTSDSGFDSHRFGSFDGGRECRSTDELVALGFTSKPGDLHNGTPTSTVWSMAAPVKSPWKKDTT